MNNLEIFASRLKNARTIKAYSMDDLVSKMDNSISKMTISKYEKCQLVPNSKIVISLANALDQTVDYFFRPFTLQVDSVKFRKHSSKLSIKNEKSIKENVSDLIERYINIEEVCNASIEFSSPFKKRISSAQQVKEAAVQLRQEWNIGIDGIANVIALLEDNGVKVMEIDAPDSFDGLSSMVNDVYPVIVLNKNFCSERKRFTALHELGHLILSFEDSITEKDEERLCNLFASEMLILESVFKNIMGKVRHDISYQELKSIQTQYGISCDALMYKAFNCKMISEQRYKTYCIKKRADENLKNILESSIYPKEQTTRFNRLVYSALSQELITISKAAELLHQDVSQVREDLALI